LDEIQDTWTEAWWTFKGRIPKEYSCLRLSDVLKFFPVQETDRWQFEPDAAKAGVRLSAAEFEPVWLQWSREEAARLALVNGIRFLQLFGLAANWQQWERKSFWKQIAIVALDPNRPARGAVKEIAQLVRLRAPLYDTCREDVDTGAFLISCPFEFARAVVGPRLIKTVPGLRPELREMHEQMKQVPYGPNVFRHELISRFFSRITAVAPKAYSGAWMPAGSAIYVRYFHRIQFGKVKPDEIVQDFRLVCEMEGSDNARVVGFLLGIALGPARVQSLARELQADQYPVAISKNEAVAG
jgi:hypothetical protein